MTQTNVLEEVRRLVALQKLDAKRYEFKKELKEKPAFLAELKEHFESKQAGLKVLEEKLKNEQVERNAQELELQSKEENIAKANAQLSQLKTNKEYTAKITEIESIKADKSIVEEKILLYYDQADAIRADIEKEKVVLAQKEKEYLSQKQEVESAVKKMEEEIQQLDDQRQKIVPQVEKATLTRYERILKNKDGLAIVPVEGTACGGCFMNIPPQVVNDIKMHDKLVFCDVCARILYLKEDMDQSA